MNCQICFFIVVAINIVVLVSWHTTPVSLCWSYDLQLQIRKIWSYRKNVALDFVLLVLKLYPIQVVISLPLWIKLTIVQLLLVFLCSFNSFFSYVGGVLVTNIFYTVRCTTKCFSEQGMFYGIGFLNKLFVKNTRNKDLTEKIFGAFSPRHS